MEIIDPRLEKAVGLMILASAVNEIAYEKGQESATVAQGERDEP
jgi:hypothetical protein